MDREQALFEKWCRESRVAPNWDVKRGLEKAMKNCSTV